MREIWGPNLLLGIRKDLLEEMSYKLGVGSDWERAPRQINQPRADTVEQRARDRLVGVQVRRG